MSARIVLEGTTFESKNRTIQSRLEHCLDLFAQRTDISLTTARSIRETLREHLLINEQTFLERPPAQYTILLKRILRDDLGPLYFSAESPGKYDYLDAEDNKKLFGALRNFMGNIEEWQLKMRDEKTERAKAYRKIQKKGQAEI